MPKGDFTPPPAQPHKCVFEHIDKDVVVTDKNNMNNSYASATITQVDSFFCPECLETKEKERVFYWSLGKEVPTWAKIEVSKLNEELNRNTRY